MYEVPTILFLDLKIKGQVLAVLIVRSLLWNQICLSLSSYLVYAIPEIEKTMYKRIEYIIIYTQKNNPPSGPSKYVIALLRLVAICSDLGRIRIKSFLIMWKHISGFVGTSKIFHSSSTFTYLYSLFD